MISKKFIVYDRNATANEFSKDEEGLTRAISRMCAHEIRMRPTQRERYLKKARTLLKELRDADK